MFKYLLILLSFVLILSCQKQMKSGINLSQMDTAVRPQDNFYQYMNGTWLKEFEIPADKSNYGMFNKLADEAEKNLQIIIEEAAAKKNKENGSNEQKVGDMYTSFMDSTKIEELGISPIEKDLQQIAAISDKQQIIKELVDLAKNNINIFFRTDIDQDGKKSTQYIMNIMQGGISLPDRDYYLKDTDRFKDIRSKYVKHVATMFSLAGMDKGDIKAKTILNFETALAQAHWTRVENRDPEKTYNKFALKDLDKKMPHFNWQMYASEAGFVNEDSLIVFQPSFLTALDGLLQKTSLEDIKTVITWNLLRSSAPYLSSDFVNQNFDFYGKTLAGIEINRPRWKRAVSSVEDALGEVVGKLYVERHFKPEAKERMKKLVDNIIVSMKTRIENLDWMSDVTKQKAIEKLSTFVPKIGYPDVWKDYSALEIKVDDLVGNMKRSALVEYNREMDKLGKPIDRKEWHMMPQTVNAYYNPSMNEVVFPAAILQPPFFNMEADDAVNYGAIGAVIGHEITHGFDDKGSQFDGEGNINNWWEKNDRDEFEKRADVMVKEYNDFNPIDTLHVNGKLTLGENIADLGGLTIAYYAYKNALAGKGAPVIDGFTGEQRFFLGWAQFWARKYRDETLRQRLLTDPHSPSEYRVNGIVVSMPEFYQAYNVMDKDGMYVAVDKRVKIW
jgi:putative endopeptidase